MNDKIGIIGIGVVGNALRKWFEHKNYNLVIYDKNKGIGSLSSVIKADIIFICVASPFIESDEFSNVRTVMSVINKIIGNNKSFFILCFLSNLLKLSILTGLATYLGLERELIFTLGSNKSV